MKYFFLTLFLAGTMLGLQAQIPGYWQQAVKYRMDIDMDVSTHQFKGTQWITYFNHSPDTLKRLYFHLYFNAFQPGSMMDIRSQTIKDPDKRITDRISKLTNEEIGYHHIKSMSCNNRPVLYDINGTIMTVYLLKPILPGDSANIYMEFNAQVPLQIRRSGRDNKEGIDYTMTQWYPKLAEYDKYGWHPDPYIGREFYGVWGDFDVTIHIDSAYTIGGTGVVQNPDEVGHGYGPSMADKAKLTWHFKAEKVHDFAWAADPDYRHDTIRLDEKLLLHFFYQTDTLADQWLEIQPQIVKVFKIINARFGRYPYSDFSIVQGGDGGMEYPMCTMILGHGTKKGKIGLIAHESIHNWFYGVLANNEFQFPWMDEGMTTYAEEVAMDSLYNKQQRGFLAHEYDSYLYLAQSPYEEPMSTPADLYNVNMAYGVNAYSKGAITLNQLRYIMGDKVFYQAMKRYFDTWKFKHPEPNDFFRIMEKTSNIELDWYVNHWVYTMHHIDYMITLVPKSEHQTTVVISRKGTMPMPAEIQITLKSGYKMYYYLPLSDMHGNKAINHPKWQTIGPWQWVYPRFTFDIPYAYEDISSAIIDPNQMTADIEPSDNFFSTTPNSESVPLDSGKKKKKKKRKKKK